jgi:hypothetical protein
MLWQERVTTQAGVRTHTWLPTAEPRLGLAPDAPRLAP